MKTLKRHQHKAGSPSKEGVQQHEIIPTALQGQCNQLRISRVVNGPKNWGPEGSEKTVGLKGY